MWKSRKRTLQEVWAILQTGLDARKPHILSMRILAVSVMAGETQGGSLRRGVFATVINNLRAPGGSQPIQIVQSGPATTVSCWENCTFS